MALILACGAECGIVGAGAASSTVRHWSTVTGAPTIDLTNPRSGSKAFSFAAAATNPSFGFNVAASQTVGYARLYLRTSNATPSSDIILLLGNITTSSNFTLYLRTTGTLEASFGGNAPQNYGTLTANTWYGVELEVDLRANPLLVRWRVWTAGGGWVSQTNVSRAVAADTFSTSGWQLGIASGPTSGTTILMDDVLLGIGTTQGEDYSTSASKGGKVLRYLPTADGTHSAFTLGDFKDTAGTNLANSATTIYQLVDDDDQQSISDYVQQAVAGAGKYVQFLFADEGTETQARVVGVTSTHHSASTASNEMHLRVSDDGTNWTNVWGDWSATGADTSDTTAHYLYKILTTKPSGGAWTQSAVNGMRVQWGNSDDVSPVPYLDSVSIEVEWTEVTATTVTVPSTPAVTGAANSASAKVQPSPSAAAATGAANTAAASVKPNAQAPAATVAVGNASVVVKPSAESTAIAAWVTEGAGSDVTLAPGAVTATVASADAKATVSPAPSAVAATVSVPDAAARTGTTVQPATVAIAAAVQTPSATILPAAGTTSATVAIADASASVEVQGGLPSPQAAVQAFDAVVVAISGTFVSAGAAAITGAASDAAAAITAAAEATSVSGAANAASAAVKPTGGAVAVTGVAYSVSATTVLAGQATITGAASSAAASVKPAAAAATVTGSATSPSVGITSPAGSAAVTGAAYSAKASVQPSAGAPAVTGSASTASVSVKAPASAATVSGSAPAASASVAASAERAAVIAAVAAAIASVKPSGGLVEITAASYQATRAGLVGVGPGPRGGTTHHHGPRGGTGHHVPRGSARDIRPR